jgi:hypothetical protein
MKNTLLFIAAAGFLFAGNAQTSLGLSVTSSLDNNSHTVDGRSQENNNNSDFELSAGPMLRIMLGNDREVDPYAGFSFSNLNKPDNFSQQLGFWLGCGYFFHAVHAGILTFSLGPDLGLNFYLPPSNSGSDYSKFGINAGVPLNFDFDFFRKYSIRISASAFRIGYSHEKSAGVSDDKGSYSLQSILTPRFTFFYTF